MALGSAWRFRTAMDDLAQRAAAGLPTESNAFTFDDEVRRCLSRTWGTERILLTTWHFADDPDVVRAANSWGAVQAYYASYGAVQGLLVSEGKVRPENHAATLRQYSDLWVGRSFDLLPWTLGLGPRGDRLGDAEGFVGARGAAPITVGQVHPWSSWSDGDAIQVAAHSLIGTRDDKWQEALTREREDKLKARKRAWKAEEEQRQAAGKRPRKPPKWPMTAKLTARESAVVRGRVRRVTLRDYLLRLRIKANYQDAAMYSEGPTSDSEAEHFLHDLVQLTAANLLIHELRLCRRVGKANVVAAVDSWTARNGSAVAEGGIELRRDLLQRYG